MEILTALFDGWVDFGSLVYDQLTKIGLIGNVLTIVLMVPWLFVCAVLLAISGTYKFTICKINA